MGDSCELWGVNTALEAQRAMINSIQLRTQIFWEDLGKHLSL